jgi:4-amino-4-deoxy-L-arabinose transferase-like glycosyltransferase
LCIAYVLPGFVGRDPWKKNDIEAFGFMLELAQPTLTTAANWLKPVWLGQLEPNLALLPIWLGAAAIRLAPAGWEALAARLPFVLMLATTLAATWYAAYSLARRVAAQPVAFAFGGEANPVDYARTLADGALLALLACLGLAQLSHETTPALSQMCFTALLLFGLSCLPRRRLWSGAAVAAGVLGLTLSGAPALGLMLLGGGALIRSLAPADAHHRRLKMLEVGLLGLLGLLAITLAGALDLWRWRLVPHAMADAHLFGRLLLWFTWPAGPLALWSLWRWRRQWVRGWQFPHIGLPFWFTLITVGTTGLTGLTDRALLSGLPGIAILAAFALPTLRRSVRAFIDWFTLLFFSIGALAIWVVWISMETGVPAQPARNVARAAPEFVHLLSHWGLAAALAATLAWLALVRWRTGKHPAALWKSLVLPAAGTTLCWSLLMTLWLPLLNHARGYAPLVGKVVAITGSGVCVQTSGLTIAQASALRYHGHMQLQEATSANASCPWLLIGSDAPSTVRERVRQEDWQEVTRIRRPTDNNETLVILTARKL